MKVDFAVIGAQKAGSTYLLEALRDHPEVHMPRSEVAFFENELFDAKQRQQFEAHFSPSAQHRVIGFKRPNLLGLPDVPKRLLDFLGPIKLIIILRNPVDRAISAYFHYMATGLLPCLPVEEGFDLLFDNGLTRWPRSNEILSFGLYGKHINHYASAFGPENIFICDIKALRQPGSLFASVFDFLGVHEAYVPSVRSNRPMAAPYSLTRIRVKRMLEAPAKKWTEGGSYFSFKSGAFWTSYQSGCRLIDKSVLSRVLTASAPEIPAVREKLGEFYQSDQQLLRDYCRTRTLSGDDLA